MSVSRTEFLGALVAERAPLLLAIAVVLSGVVLLPKLFSRVAALDHLPLVGKELGGPDERRKAYMADSTSLYEEGYKRYEGKPFRITTSAGERVAVPPTALDELRNLPQEILNVNKELDKMISSKYTGVAGYHAFMTHLIKADLNRKLNGLVENLSVQAARTVSETYPSSEEWTPVVLHKKVLDTVAILSGSVFIGADNCRDPEYVKYSILSAVIVHEASQKIRAWKPALRWLGQYLVPELREVTRLRERFRRIAEPVIRERRRRMQAGDASVPDDMLTWMLAKADEWDQSDEQLALTEMQLSMGAIQTSAMTTSAVLYELATRPEVVALLREEAREVLAAHGGRLATTRALYDLRLLDSVLKESQRVNPTSATRFPRSVERQLTLRDGTVLPAGACLDAVFSPLLRDPKYYPDPERFDPYRFVKLRSGEVPDPNGYRNKDQYQFIAANKEDIFWSYGYHACPGRFFAVMQIKLAITYFLSRFEIQRPGGSREKVEPISVINGKIPDFSAVFEVKARPKESWVC